MKSAISRYKQFEVTMSEILNVGIVGTGIFAKSRHLPSYEELSDNFKVVAAFNRTKSKAQDFAKIAGIPDEKVYDDLDGILNDKEVSFVDILLPVQFNATTVEKCIAAGKPALLEKPIAANLEQARKIVKLADSTELPIGIAENWLFLNSISVVKEKLASIGIVTGFTYNSTGPFAVKNKYMSTSWRQRPEHIGGFLSDGGVHQLALLTDILGEIESVSALTKQLRKESGSDDIVFSTLKLRESDAIGTFTYGSAFGSTDKWIFLKIYGTNGSIILDVSNKSKPIVRVTVGDSAEADAEEETIEVDEGDSFGVNMEFVNFHEAVVKGDKSIVRGSPKVAFHHLACVAAFLESSSKNGDHVEVAKP